MKACRIAALFLAGTLALPLFGCAREYEGESAYPSGYLYENNKYLCLPERYGLFPDRLYQEDGRKFYYWSKDRAGKVDGAIDNVKEVLPYCPTGGTVYLSSAAVTHVYGEEIWIDPDDSPALILACLLANKDGEELPFGVYAGVSSYLLGEKPRYAGKALAQKLEEFPYCRELQYPLYATYETSAKERDTAWSLGYEIASAWLSADTLDGLLASSSDDWTDIFEEYGVELPEYRFLVGDNYYATRLEAGELRYLFPRDYVDRYYEEEDFSLAYPVLTEFARGGMRYMEWLRGIWGVEKFEEPIDLYLGGIGSGYDFLHGDGSSFAGYLDYDKQRRPYIVCNTVCTLAHELAHAVIIAGGQNYVWTLNEAMPEYFAHLSPDMPWENKMYYNVFVREEPYHDKCNPQETTKEQFEDFKKAKELYLKAFGAPTEETYSYIKYVLARVCRDGATYEKLNDRSDFYSEYDLIKIAFVDYLYTNYGLEALCTVDRLWDAAEVDGKDFSTLVSGFIDWLNAIFE